MDLAQNIKKSKLESAAEELVKAASAHTDVNQVRMLQGCMDSLKATVETKIDELSPGINAAGKDVSTSIDELKATMDTAIGKMDASQVEIKKIVSNQKTQTLQWAITHVFHVWNNNTAATTVPGVYNPKGTVVGILFHFMRGDGSILEEPNDDCYREQMHESLINEIHKLTGVKPRITKLSDDKRYAIYWN